MRATAIVSRAALGLLVSAFTFTALNASAQDVSVRASTETGYAGTGVARATGNTDHDRFVGSFAIGYLGASLVPVANLNVGSLGDVAGPAAGLTAEAATAYAPVIGVRYWFNETIGLDAGFGLRTFSGSVERDVVDTTTQPDPQPWSMETDDVSQTAFLLHVGVPIALKAERHYVFELIPEANLGFASGTYTFPTNVPPSQANQPRGSREDVDLSGMRFDIGVRAGAEVHFGFIGIPNLALQAGVGMYLTLERFKAEGAATTLPDGTPGFPSTSYKHSSTTFTTSVFNDPWAIFTNNVSALYYF